MPIQLKTLTVEIGACECSVDTRRQNAGGHTSGRRDHGSGTLSLEWTADKARLTWSAADTANDEVGAVDLAVDIEELARAASILAEARRVAAELDKKKNDGDDRTNRGEQTDRDG